MPVITIGRQYGAGGEAVGRMVANQLGAELVDAKFFVEVARRLELPPDEVERLEEVPGSFLNRVLQAMGTASIRSCRSPPDQARTRLACTASTSLPAIRTRNSAAAR